MHSTAPPAIQVKVTPLRPVSGRPEPFLFSMVTGILVESTFLSSSEVTISELSVTVSFVSLLVASPYVGVTVMVKLMEL